MVIPKIANHDAIKDVTKPEKGVTYKPGQPKRTKFVKIHNTTKSKVGQDLVLQKERERMRSLKQQANKRQKRIKEEQSETDDDNPNTSKKRIIYQNRTGNHRPKYKEHAHQYQEPSKRSTTSSPKKHRSPRKNHSSSPGNLNQESPKQMKHRVKKIINRHRQSQALIAELSQLEAMVSNRSPKAVPFKVKKYLEIEEQVAPQNSKKKKKPSTKHLKIFEELGKTEVRKKQPKKRRQGYLSRDPYRSKAIIPKRRNTMPSTRPCVFSPSGDILPSIKESPKKHKEYNEITALSMHQSYDSPDHLAHQRLSKSPQKDLHPTFIEYHNKHRQRYVSPLEEEQNEPIPHVEDENRASTPALSDISEGWKYSSPASSIHPMMRLSSPMHDDYKINHAIQKKQEQQEAHQKLREQAFLQAEFKRAIQKAKKQAIHDQKIATKRAASHARMRATLERSAAIKEARVLAIKDKLAKDDFKDIHKEAVAQNIRKMVRKRKAWLEKVKAKDKVLIRKARHHHMQSIYGQNARKKHSGNSSMHHALFDI